MFRTSTMNKHRQIVFRMFKKKNRQSDYIKCMHADLNMNSWTCKLRAAPVIAQRLTQT